MHRSQFGRSDRSTCANDGGHRTSSSSDRSTCDGGGRHRNTSSSEHAPTLVVECISPAPAMISLSAPVVGHITLAPAVSAAPFSCGGVNRTCSRNGSSTCAWSGGHRGSTCRDRSVTHGSVWSGRTSPLHGAPQCHVSGQLCSTETWQVLCQDFNPPVICCADLHVHVPKKSIELHTSPCLSTDASQPSFRWRRPLLEASRVPSKGIVRFMARFASRLCQQQRQTEPLQEQHAEEVWRYGELPSRGSVRQCHARIVP